MHSYAACTINKSSCTHRETVLSLIEPMIGDTNVDTTAPTSNVRPSDEPRLAGSMAATYNHTYKRTKTVHSGMERGDHNANTTACLSTAIKGTILQNVRVCMHVLTGLACHSRVSAHVACIPRSRQAGPRSACTHCNY